MNRSAAGTLSDSAQSALGNPALIRYKPPMTQVGGRPPRVHPFLHWLGKVLFRLAGWKVEGSAPAHDKAVIIAAPHTSYLDGPIMVTAGCIFDVRFSWMVKQAAMFFPLGILVRYFGGIGVDRSKRNNMVTQSIEEFRNADAMLLAIAPEGTRSRGSHWKTGFYRIALGAGVPVVLGYIDYARKVAGLGPAIELTGDIDADFRKFAEFYANVTPRHPERRGAVTAPPEKVDQPRDEPTFRNVG